jgi:HSP20 family protein
MSVLTNFDPFFRDMERLSEGMLGRLVGGAPRLMPADAYRRGDDFFVSFDLPGVDDQSVEVTVEKNVLSVTAERHWERQDGDQVLLSERPEGRFTRQLYLSDNLDTDRIEAHYDRGVLTLRIPVTEQAKPKKVEVRSGGRPEAISTTSQNS